MMFREAFAAMMNKPSNPDVDLDMRALLIEADCRIRFALEMLGRAEDDSASKVLGGYHFAIVSEVLADVAGTLKAAADHVEAP
jgi:hypothetical protein